MYIIYVDLHWYFLILCTRSIVKIYKLRLIFDKLTKYYLSRFLELFSDSLVSFLFAQY
jgi:hypothetical protein